MTFTQPATLPSLARFQRHTRGRLHAPDSRTAGWILVAAVHVAIALALAQGLRREAHQPPPDLVVRVIDQPRPSEPVVQPPAPLAPQTPTVTPRQIEIPVIPTLETPPVRTEPVIATAEPSAVDPAVKGDPPMPTQTAGSSAGSGDRLVSPGVVCSSMTSPVLPATSWGGEALLRATAQVENGRVVGTQIQVVSGSLDARTRRALTGAVDTALHQYVCPGNHRFTQDFAFRVD